jgi:GNAT superfamily N-acetyltransferase
MSLLKRFLNFVKPVKIDPNDIIIVKTINDDTWNKIPKSEVYSEFYHEDKKIGYINYRLGTGQIGLFWLESDYRNKGIGKTILQDVIKEMKNANQNEIWAATFDSAHPFWSNVFEKKFKWHEPTKLHHSVTGGGFKMEI